MKARFDKYGFFNFETGEVSQDFIVLHRKQFQEPFVRFFVKAAERISNLPLGDQARRVLTYLQSHSDWSNQVPQQRDCAHALKMNPGNANRAYRKLLQYDILLYRQGRYYLNPTVTWKGTIKQLHDAMTTYLAPPAKRPELESTNAK